MSRLLTDYERERLQAHLGVAVMTEDWGASGGWRLVRLCLFDGVEMGWAEERERKDERRAEAR